MQEFNESEETERYAEQAADILSAGKKIPPLVENTTGGASSGGMNMAKLQQIENAIDCLLAQ